jgi:ADP-ribosylglycohydrolase
MPLFANHESRQRSQRARLSLDGLSIGDAFGQRFFFPWVVERASPTCLPEAPWHYTDDTEMAMAIVQILETDGHIDQTRLGNRFAARFQAEPGRGYGAGARELLIRLAQGDRWEDASRGLFGGTGSYGNGGAMRAPPLGAWYADDVSEVIEQARLSAEVTHGHPEGQAGAIATALATSWTWRWASAGRTEQAGEMLTWVARHLPESETREGVARAAQFALDAWQFDVAAELGCGERITSQDTVPFCLWMAATSLEDYVEALFRTARVGGDIDTNCAIVGGIVAMSVGVEGIPQEWLSRREALNW